MPELFLGALGVTLLILLLQELEHAETKLLVKTLKWTFVAVIFLAAIYLTLVGRLLYVAAIIVLLILLLKQDVQQWLKVVYGYQSFGLRLFLALFQVLY